LRIATRKLLVQNGAAVSSNTSGQEQGGTLNVTASESIKLSGTSADGQVSSGLFAQTEDSGAAGNLKIATGQLQALDGAVVSASSTSGATGQGGTLDVTASESVKLSGTSADGRVSSGLYAENLGMGAAGNLKIATGQLQILDGAVVSASTSSGQGGNITLGAQDLLILRRGSNISSTAGTANAGGDGGNITIDTPFIVAVPTEDSNITANAFKGKGGFIKITAQGIFGLKRSENLIKLSAITAFSQQKPELNGIVEINTPNVEPSRGLVTLPTGPVDVTGLIAQRCSAGEGQAASEFIITGRGGLPPTPRETLSSDTVLEDWGTLALVPAEPLSTQRDRVSSQPDKKHQRLSGAASYSLGDSDVSTYPVHSTPAPLVEAQGWIIGANNEVVLTAQAPTVTHYNPWLTPGGCHRTT
jgi:large exoprotein involved in heme utilization and adhesion